MRRLTLGLAVLMLCATAIAQPTALDARRRAVQRGFTVIARFFDPALIVAPASGWPKGAIDERAETPPPIGLGLGPGPYVWKLRVSTTNEIGWTYQAWIDEHWRLHDGVLDIIVWRSRKSINCAASTFTIPAQPNQSAEFVVDMSGFEPSDALLVEQWEGVEATLTITNGAGAIGEVGSWKWPVNHPSGRLIHQQFDWTRCDGGRP